MSEIPKDLQAMPFGQMIGAPLSACIEAQEKAAMTSVKFIRNVGFEKDKRNVTTNKVINVVFQYKRDDDEVQLTVPLLTIVPIPFIAIDTVNISFKANLRSITQSNENYTSDSSSGWDYAYDGKKVDFNASVSTKKDSKATQTSQYSVEATIDVNVIGHQDSMPAGLAKVLEMLNQAISIKSPTS